MIERLREWRIDRMTDRVARRPHGRKARAVYGAADAHSFAWEPMLEALRLGPADVLLDVGCGGGVFLNRALETGCTAVGLDHSREMVKLSARTNAQAVRDGRLRVVRGEADRFFFFTDPVRVLRELCRVLDPQRGRLAVFTTPPEAKGTPAAPYPLATRGRFYEDAELERLPVEAGFVTSTVRRTDIGAQLLVARV